MYVHRPPRGPFLSNLRFLYIEIGYLGPLVEEGWSAHGEIREAIGGV